MSEVMAGQWLLAAAVRSVLVLLVVWLLAVAFRRSSAAVLYRIWFLGLMSCLVLLPIGSVLPQWKLGVLPAVAAEVPFGVDQFNAIPSIAETSYAAPLLERSPASISAPSLEEIGAIDEVSKMDLEVESMRGDSHVMTKTELTVSAAIAVWLMGVVALALRYVYHWNGARCLRLVCRLSSDQEWRQLVEASAKQLQLKRFVAIGFHVEEISPMVVGILQPMILLPESANQWSSQRRGLVLMHELSHIQRNDLAMQFVASIVCAIYWLNPLVWIASRQMKKLREIACDDAVIEQTAQPAVYAEMLLKVALDQRERAVAGAIAMARANNVKDRIRCILDNARCRNPLSLRLTFMLTLLSLGFSILVGTGVLTTNAQDAKPNEATKEEARTAPVEEKVAVSATAPETRKMMVRVVDDEGKPLADSNIHVGVWEFGKRSEYANRDYQTDSQGKANIVIPKRIEILRLWARKTNFVPMFVNFQRGTHDDGQRIADAYEFQLQKGHKLSGQIIDESGKPVADARVQVSLDLSDKNWGPNPTPSYDMWLAEDKDAAITNQNGQWEIGNAPATDYAGGFRLLVSHPEYAGDSEWGGLQNQQKVTTEQLRDGSAVLTLNNGLRLTGTIANDHGVAITKGLVVWSNDPYLADGTNETQIDSSGRFETSRLKPGVYPITILAPGYAPQQHQVDLRQDMQQTNYTLQPGRTVSIRIVDPAGNAIPNAYVGIGKWRNGKAIFNNIHPNVPSSGIPTRASEQGIYVWDWAPEDPVEFYVGAEGYDPVSLTLAADPNPREIKLTSRPLIHGKVVDKDTGKPIANFRIIPVRRQGADISTDFLESLSIQNEEGKYEYKIKNSRLKGYSYQLRIEADGYRSVIGTTRIAVGDQAVEENFELERAAPRTISVLDANNKPVNNFEVAVSTPTSTSYFSFERQAVVGRHFEVNGTDRFTIAKSFEPSLIRVYNDDGFAEILDHKLSPLEPSVQLQPWASLKGRLMQGDRPIAKCAVTYTPFREHQREGVIFYENYSVVTDDEGYFHFNKLPPLQGHVGSVLDPWHDSPLTSSESLPVQLQPGKTTEVELGAKGVTVSGRVVATHRSNDEFSQQWSRNYLIRYDGRRLETDSANYAYGFGAVDRVDLDWTNRIGFYDWLEAHQNYSVRLGKDGEVQISGVEPGEYDLLIQLYDQPAGCLVEITGAKIVPLTITANQAATGKFELGNIEVPCRQGPRVGTDMRAYEFMDASGVRRSVDSMQGKYIFFHVWASWCEPCLASMPAMVVSARKYAQSPITFVGFNIDKDQEQAERFVSNLHLQWTQNYLGPKPELMQQLAIASVPAYYLVGPDGKLVGSSENWSVIEELLEQRLSK